MRNNSEFKELVNSKHKALIKQKKQKQKNALIISSSLFVCVLLCIAFLRSDAIRRTFTAESVYDTVFESEELESQYDLDSSVLFIESAEIEQDSDYIAEEEIRPIIPEFDECVSETVSVNDSGFVSIFYDSNEDNETYEEASQEEAGTETVPPLPENEDKKDYVLSFNDLPFKISWSDLHIINRTYFEEAR